MRLEFREADGRIELDLVARGEPQLEVVHCCRVEDRGLDSVRRARRGEFLDDLHQRIRREDACPTLQCTLEVAEYGVVDGLAVVLQRVVAHGASRHLQVEHERGCRGDELCAVPERGTIAGEDRDSLALWREEGAQRVRGSLSSG